MQLALECPTELLSDIQPLADFDWLLTHLVLQDKGYAQFYSKSTRFKILDNSVNELLEPCSLDAIARAAEIVKPDYIVAPDYLGSGVSTMEALDGAINRFGFDKIFPVVQGSTVEDALGCVDFIVKLGFDRLAVPYDITCSRRDELEIMAVSRLNVVNATISNVPIGFKIHLLGMTTLEELSLHNTGWVKSIDTGSPVMHGMYYLRFGECNLLSKEEPTLRKMREGKDLEDMQGSYQDIYYNIAFLRKVLNEQ